MLLPRRLLGALLLAAAMACSGDSQDAPAQQRTGLRALDLLGRFAEAEVTAPPRGAALQRAEVAGVERAAVFLHPPGEARFGSIETGTHPRLELAIALRDAAWRQGGDGVGFEVAVLADGQEQRVFEQHLDPARRAQDRGWLRHSVSLEAFAGRSIDLVLRTTAGPQGDATFDHALWGELRLVSEVPLARALPNVVLVSLDTLRADHLGAYGDERGLTPHLDALAARGVVFERALSTSAWTRPAHFSLMTGLQPDRALLRYDETNCEVVSEVETLAERLAAEGYLTAAFTGGGYLNRASGFAQGFAFFESHGRRFEANLPFVRDWLDTYGDGPFFLFLHNYNAHRPYAAPARQLTRLLPDVPAACAGVSFSAADRDSGRWAACMADPAARTYLEAAYAAEVAQVDELLGEVVAQLEASQRLSQTLFVVTSDHGEELLDHGRLDHVKTLYQELIAVPLIFAGPGVPGGRRIDAPVQLLDVMPTLLDWLGLEPRPGVAGRSLVAVVDGVEAPARTLFAASTWDATLEIGDPWDFKAAALTGTRKLILNTRGDAQRLEAYDLAADPAEATDLAGGSAPFRALEAELRRFVDGMPASGYCWREALDREMHDELRALGYLE